MVRVVENILHKVCCLAALAIVPFTELAFPLKILIYS